MRQLLISRLTALAIFCLLITPAVQAVVPPIPSPSREYRAAWCATVTNIDWPPQAGVSTSIVDAQKARLLAHINGLADAKMNAMYFQARPACDAMYISTIEPPSQWLTGSQNTAATWDPLAFAVTECHNRGIEVHAWVNPYRAALDQVTTNKAPNHVMRAHPEYCKTYSDGRTYLDPGKPEVIAYIKSVIGDIVTRYDVDGVVFDDYFYPGTDFDDAATYLTYTTGGGTMTLDDWRRDNVNQLIHGLYDMIHGIRLSCQFEVGPFGIWRPGYPSTVSGSDYYATHYCDTRLWLQSGWVDSLSPQLYWTLASPGQPFGDLIDWWVQQNPARHVMASTADYRVGSSNYANWGGTTNAEICNQVIRTYQAGGVGNVHYSIKFLTDNTNLQRTALKAGPYALDALRPASTWIENVPPPAPSAAIGAPSGSPAKRTISFSQHPGDEPANWWCVYSNDGTTWTLKVLPGATTSIQVDAGLLAFAVSAVDRVGNESARQTPTSSLGTVRLDRVVYKPGDTIRVHLFDGDLVGSGSIVLAVGSTSEPTGEQIALTETSAGAFDGSITLAAGPAVAGDGLLQVADLDSIVVFYHDQDNGSGQPADVTATAAVDAAVPAVSNVQVAGITGTAAQISFDTNEQTTAIVQLGTSCGSFTRVLAPANSTISHVVSLAGLNTSTTYYFVVTASDPAGNVVIDDNSGSCFSFTTSSYPGVPFYDGFESGSIGSAWTISGTGNYRTSATSAYGPQAGTYHMLMETTSAAYALNQATLTLDLADAEDVTLSFQAKGFSEESHSPPAAPFTNAAQFDGVSISADGTNWYEVQALRVDGRNFQNFYEPFFVDLDSAVAGLGLSYNGGFKIRFNQYDNQVMPNDGIAVDEVYVGGTVGDDLKVSPVNDFVTSGPLGGPWVPAGSTYVVRNSGAQPMDWTVGADQPWVTLSPASGRLEPGEQASVAVGIAASDLELGTYKSVITFNDATSGRSKTRNVKLIAGAQDWFTQTVISSTPIENTMFTFKPDGLQSYYSVCRTTVSALPSTTAGTTLSSLRDDNSVSCALTGGKTFSFYGTTYSSFYVGSNGFITFTAGDSDYTPTLADHFRLPRIAAMFNDLYPKTAGPVTWSQQSDRAVVSYNTVVHANTGRLLSTFQIEMFFDGTIRITYLSLNKEGIMGLSAGQGVPQNFYESVFESYPSCNMASTAPVLSGSAVSQTRVALSWTDLDNETTYVIERKQAGTDFAPLALLRMNRVTYLDNDVTTFTEYVYRVYGFNVWGQSDYSNEVTVRTPDNPPAAPGWLGATVISQTQIDLTWGDDADNETTYLVKRHTEGLPFSVIATLPPDSATYSDSDVSTNTTYYYQVDAENSGGVASSEEVSATTLPEPPTAPSNFRVTGVSQTVINLQWIDTSSNESEFQLERKAPGDPDFDLIAKLSPDTQSYDDPGLVANSTYAYRIRALNTGGVSAYADELTTRTLPEPPPAPTGLVATVLGQASIKLDWTDVSQNEDGYLIQRTGPGAAGPTVLVAVLGANAITYTDSGLQSDSDYTYSVTAFNTGGRNGAQAMAHTLPYPPNAPTGLGGAPAGQTSVQLTWTDSSDNEVSFEIERWSVDKYASLGNAPKDASSYDDGSLAPDTEYVYRVRAVNTGGASAYTPEFTVRTLPYPPSPPTGLSATVLSQTEIALTWADTSSNEDQIILERQTPGGSFAAVQTFAPDTTSYTDSGLTPDTTYVYRVRSANRGGSSAWCLSAEATTLKVPPTAPILGSVTALSVSSLQVAWDGSGSGATSICIERLDVDAIDFVEIAVVDAVDSSCIDTSLLPDTTYTYRVRGWNNGGYSPYSGYVSGHTINDVLPGTLKRTVLNPAPRSNDKFGWSVAVFRDIAVIGAPLADEGAKDTGVVYVYDLKTSAPPVIIHNPEPGKSDQFGWSVATDGKRVVVGAPWDDAGGKDAGSAYLFSVDGSLVGRLTNPNPAQYDHFGWSVALEGITSQKQIIAPKELAAEGAIKVGRLIAVGAPGKDTAAKDAGSVYLFDGTTLLRTVTSPSAVVGGLFGWSVDMAAGQLGVGSPNDSTNATNAGAVFVFSGPDMSTYRSYLGSGARDLFGFSVRFADAGQILAGSPADEQSAGNFTNGDPTATKGKKPVTKKKPVQDCGLAYLLLGDSVKLLSNPVPARTDKFGFACATGSRTNVIGAPYDDAGAADAGSVFLYSKDSDEMVCIPNPSPAASDWFGWSVAACANVILVGAPFDDTGARNAGCVYIYAGYGN